MKRLLRAEAHFLTRTRFLLPGFLVLLVLYALLRLMNYPSMELLAARSDSHGMELEAYTELYLRGALQQALSDRSFVFFIAAMSSLGLITWSRESGQLRLYRQTGHNVRTVWLMKVGLVLAICAVVGLLEPLCVVGRYRWFWREVPGRELAEALALRTLNVLALAPVSLLVALLTPADPGADCGPAHHVSAVPGRAPGPVPGGRAPGRPAGGSVRY